MCLNRNSSQRMSQSSLLTNKMLGSVWLRGKEDKFKDIVEGEHFSFKKALETPSDRSGIEK